MQILCTQDEWAIFEQMLIERYNISMVYNFPKFVCVVYEVGNEDELFQIEGDFLEEEEND